MKIIFLVLMLIVANVAIAQTSSTRKKDESPHTSGFVTGNGVRRNYLDWGGYRDVILFLTGIGDTAHVFDRTCECHFNSRSEEHTSELQSPC